MTVTERRYITIGRALHQLSQEVWDAAGQAEARTLSYSLPKTVARMRAKRISRFERIVQRLAKPLHLDRWWITVNGEPLKHRADCECSPEYTEATLTFDASKIKDGDTVSFAIHELMHCHVEGLAHIAELLAGDDCFKKEMVRLEEERLTTALEKILTPLLAAVAEPTSKRRRK